MIRVDKTHVEYVGTQSMLLSEVTMLLRDLCHVEHCLSESDFDKMKELVFKSDDDMKKEASENVVKDLDGFISFLKKMAGKNETDD